MRQSMLFILDVPIRSSQLVSSTDFSMLVRSLHEHWPSLV